MGVLVCMPGPCGMDGVSCKRLGLALEVFGSIGLFFFLTQLIYNSHKTVTLNLAQRKTQNWVLPPSRNVWLIRTFFKKRKDKIFLSCFKLL